jgi:hypothetical protein
VSLDGACTNHAESYFSRLRRSELGHHHNIPGPYLVRYAQEAAWREDLRRVSNAQQVYGVVGFGDAVQPVDRLLRLLATRPGRLDQPPTDDAPGFHPRDRLLRPVQRAENRFLDQLTAVIIGRRYCLGAHDPLGEFARRHWTGRIAQLVID